MNNDERLFILAPNYPAFVEICRELKRNRLSHNTVYLGDRTQLFGRRNVNVYLSSGAPRHPHYFEILDYLKVVGYKDVTDEKRAGMN